MTEPDTYPPLCASGKQCSHTHSCDGGECEYGHGSVSCDLHHLLHECAHDWTSGPWIEAESSASCACGMTAFSHDMRYGP